MVVDDDPWLLDALRLTFETDGFDVSTFASGEDLLAADASVGRCFVLDLRLPGLDGLDLLARLRLLGVKAPAILITTPTSGVSARAAAAGVTLVEKPLLSRHLLTQVRRVMSAA
jgi:FixJ family two-component response regulator